MPFDPTPLAGMDRKVHDWLTANIGPVLDLTRHPRWRPGWDAIVQKDGAPLPLYVRGPRGDSYVSPVDMMPEAEIHRIFEAQGIPAPRVLGMIPDPLSIVMTRVPGRIDSATIADPATRRRIREEYIAIVAHLHRIPVAAFAPVGLAVPSTPEEIAMGLYAPAEAIFRKNIGRPFPLMTFIARWLRRNVPKDRTRAAFVNFDAGQFDFEVSSFGDPAAELAGLRIRDTAEPLGDISALIDHYEVLTGDRISRQLTEYHTAGFCGTNGFLMWPILFASTPEQDYVAYMQFSVAASRFAIRAIADHGGHPLADPAEPRATPGGFAQAGRHLVRQLEVLPGGTPAEAYARDSAAALARYQQRQAIYSADILAADMADAEALVGRPLADWDAAQVAVEDHVTTAGPAGDVALAAHFHRWLKRQDFLLHDCGPAYAYVGLDLQPIADR